MGFDPGHGSDRQSHADPEHDSRSEVAYAVALSIGSDVYITFAGAWENAGYNTRRHSLTVRAYETSSGRLLGTETGYSQARQGEAMISVEEAATGAIDAVLARIDAYWRDDIRRGVQYKMILSIDTSFDKTTPSTFKISS